MVTIRPRSRSGPPSISPSVTPIVALIVSTTVLGLATLATATAIVLATGTATALTAVGGLLSTILTPAWLGLSAALAPGRHPAAPRRTGPGARDRARGRPSRSPAAGPGSRP